MKKWIIVVWIALLMVLCVGCSKIISVKTSDSNQSNSDTQDQSDEENTEMTEQREEVFRSYGVSDEEIDRMKREGLSYKEQSFVDTALMMLNYLEEKYNEKFQVVGGIFPEFYQMNIG